MYILDSGTNIQSYWILRNGTLMAVCETEEPAKKIVDGLNRDEYRNGRVGKSQDKLAQDNLG